MTDDARQPAGTVSARLQEMLDHYEISKVLNAYCHGCDRGDQLLMESVYAEESWDEHGQSSGTGKDFTRTIMSGLPYSRCISHLQGQTTIHVQGDEAGAETYFFAVVCNELDGKEVVNQLGGRYVDRLVREGGGWKIRHRTCVRDWSISLPVEADWIGTRGHRQGARSGEDPSYGALGLTHSGIPGFEAPGAKGQ